MYKVYRDTVIRDRVIVPPTLIYQSSILIFAYIVAWFKCGEHDHCRIIKK